MDIKHSAISNTQFKLPVKKRKYYREYKRKYRQNGRDKNVKYISKNPFYHRDYYRTIKDCVIHHYSEGKNICACCGEKERKFLALDHIYGNGKNHRKEIKVNLYWWCKKNNFPKGFQVLCHNCNMAKGFWGKCPHKLSS